MDRSEPDGSTVKRFSAAEAFATLANPTRLAVLRTLWEAPDEPLSFSELRSRVGVADSGNFNHHINRLVGHFLGRTDEGYRLRSPGKRVIRAIVADVVEDHRSFSPVEVDEACPFCGGTAELRYVDGQLVARCLVCDGAGTHEEGFPPGTFFRVDYPPSGLWDRSSEAVLSAAYAYYDFKSLPMMADVCPECASTIDVSVDACDEHDVSDGQSCESCGTVYEAWIELVCGRCRYTRVVPARCRSSRTLQRFPPSTDPRSIRTTSRSPTG